MKNFVTFKSELFSDELLDDECTDPGVITKKLADWLSRKLPENGLPVLKVIPEDWGICITITWKPYSLFIGCNAYFDQPYWYCFVMAELGFIQQYIRKIDTTPEINRVCDALNATLIAEPGITDIRWIEESEL